MSIDSHPLSTPFYDARGKCPADGADLAFELATPLRGVTANTSPKHHP
jgi:hypothetical protein